MIQLSSDTQMTQHNITYSLWDYSNIYCMREEKNTIIRLFEHSVKGKQKVFHNFPGVSNPPIVINIISREDRLCIF